MFNTKLLNWMKWGLVLPTVLLVLFGIRLILQSIILFLPISSQYFEVIYGPYVSLLSEFVHYAIAPFWSVFVAAKVAPKNQFEVSMILAGFFICAQTILVVLVFIAGPEQPLVTIFGSITLVAAVIFSSYKVKQDCDLEIKQNRGRIQAM